jgi:hypothetical protein
MEIHNDEAVNKVLEELNRETRYLFPFLEKENLAKYPKIRPEDLGCIDLTRRGN